MKLYIASKYPNKDRVALVATQLRDAGFEITSTWHRERYDKDVQLKDVRPNRLKTIAERDLKELSEADALVVYTAGCRRSRGGMWVEMGIALGIGMPVFVIGERVTVFCYLGQVKCYRTVEEFLEACRENN